MVQNISLFILIVLFTLGCVGPVLNHENGRSLGKNNHEFKVISSTRGYWGFRYNTGIHEDIDVGVSVEALNFGVSGKYSFINQDQGLALAAAIGLGSTFGGDYYSASFISSYGMGSFEPFASVRFTFVNIDESEINDSDTDSIFTTAPLGDYSYTQAFLGAKFWITDRFGLSTSVGAIVGESDEINFENDVLTSIAAEIKF